MMAAEMTVEDDLTTADTPLLRASRIKLQSLRGLAEEQSSEPNVEKFPSLPVVQDYNQLLALVRKALPELKLAFPVDIITPYHTEYKAAQAAKKAFWEHFLPSWHPSRTPEPEDIKLITYRELFTLCRQIERLLK